MIEKVTVAVVFFVGSAYVGAWLGRAFRWRRLYRDAAYAKESGWWRERGRSDGWSDHSWKGGGYG